MLPDVGMVQMYSKSANVNDPGYAWTGWPSSLHEPVLLLVPTVFLPAGLPCPPKTHCTIPTSALVFGGNIFAHLKNELIPGHVSYIKSLIIHGCRRSACAEKV